MAGSYNLAWATSDGSDTRRLDGYSVTIPAWNTINAGPRLTSFNKIIAASTTCKAGCILSRRSAIYPSWNTGC